MTPVTDEVSLWLEFVNIVFEAINDIGLTIAGWVDIFSTMF